MAAGGVTQNTPAAGWSEAGEPDYPGDHRGQECGAHGNRIVMLESIARQVDRKQSFLYACSWEARIMTNLCLWIRNALQDHMQRQEGATMTEYGLLVALIAVVAIVAVAAFGQMIPAAYRSFTEAF
jgi:Flp pilus assembly pilin Flp